MKIPSLFTVLILVGLANSSLAMPFPQEDPMQALSNAIEAHLANYSVAMAEKGYRSSYQAGKLDPRLNIKHCPEQWNISFTREPLKHARTSLLLACEGPERQKLFLSVEFEIYAPAVLSSNLIARGQRITEADVVIAEQQINAARYPVFESTDQVIGMVAKRTIRADRQIHPGLLTAPRLVSRGDEVIIVATNDTISIRMKGEAMNHGTRGEQISVRNKQSQRMIKARVAEQGVVEIAL
ncbi:MAG: flagella basal body P-ring formation protein FlgA [Oleiphilus sp.]|nr:MAG: flagella basal body P-ring formation protein FlgA [Oleiphilus sp.]